MSPFPNLSGRTCKAWSALCAAFVLTVGVVASAQAAPPLVEGPEAALARSRAAEGGQVGDHAFTDHRGRPVNLAQFRGRPLVISMIYTSCYHTCPLVTETLARAVEAARDALGPGSFAVVSVGFDTRFDTPRNMRSFARQQGIRVDDWLFLSGDQETVNRLADDLGFTFFVSSRGFDHITQTTILDAEGRVYRHVYGETFEAPQLVEPLKDLVYGRAAALTSVSAVIDRVRWYCTVYDPNSGAYRFDYSFFIELVVGLTIIILLTVFVLQSLRRQKAGHRPFSRKA